MRKAATQANFHRLPGSSAISKIPIKVINEHKDKTLRDKLDEPGSKTFRISNSKGLTQVREVAARDETTLIKDQGITSMDKAEDGKTRRSSKYTKLTLNLKRTTEPDDFNSGSAINHGAVKFSSDLSSGDQTLLSGGNIGLNKMVPRYQANETDSPGPNGTKKSHKDSQHSRRTTRAIPIMPNDMIYKDIGNDVDPMDELVERAGVKNINKWENDKILDQGRHRCDTQKRETRLEESTMERWTSPNVSTVSWTSSGGQT